MSELPPFDVTQCKCVVCEACDARGQVWVDTGSWPEEELEICLMCEGLGYIEECDYCRWRDDVQNEALL